MKIVVVHNRYRSSQPSGENRVVDQERAALLDAGHTVVPFERSSDEISELPPHRKALVALSVIRNRGAASELDELLLRERPDIVHVHNVFPLLSPSVLQVCAYRATPCVVTLHHYREVCPVGTLFRGGAPCRDCVGRLVALPGLVHGCYRGSVAATAPIVLSSALNRRLWQTIPSAYIFLSGAQRQEMGTLRLPATRCFVKGNAVPPPSGSRVAEDIVVYLGRLTEAKGLRVLMSAWDRYSADRRGTKLRLLLAGSGPLEQEIASWADSRPSVAVLGLLDQTSCAELLRRARAVVVPSEWPETFGLVAAEAMAASVPTIATAHGSFIDLIDDGVTGFLYRPGDSQGLAGILRRVAEEPAEVLDAMGNAAREKYATRFHPSENLGQLEAVYRFAIDHPRHAPGSASADGRTPGADMEAKGALEGVEAPAHSPVMTGRPLSLSNRSARRDVAIRTGDGAVLRKGEPMDGPRTDGATQTHLDRLESEAIYIMREAVAESANPVMLYSIGKDSSVMLHLAQKAFFPSTLPFPLLHVDTTWKFRDMYAFRDEVARQPGVELIVHRNPDALAANINPFTHGSQQHTTIWKTEGLKQALDKHGFDLAFGGARRDEERSRAKERVFSFRSPQHQWDPKRQRPELWRLYNARTKAGGSVRVFPLSNWTELDVWLYIHREAIPVVPLYLAKERPVVERDGTLIMVDDERFPLADGERPEHRMVRFRTLGCYPLTGAIPSTADTLPAVIQEIIGATTSERQGRVIDFDETASMEKKKQEGYF